MFETTIGPGEGGGLDRLPAPRDRAGHLHQLQERPAVRAQEAAVRHRADRQVVPQRDHARQLHLPHARVRADGDGVLRAARRGAAVVRALAASERDATGTCDLGIRPDHLRLRAHDADELSPLLVAARATSSTCSRSAGPSSRASPTAATSTSPSTPSSPARSSSTSTRQTGERYVPHVIEPAAGADRAMLAFLVDAYDEEEVEGEHAHRAAAAPARWRR